MTGYPEVLTTDLEITVKQLGGVTRQTPAPEAKRPRPLPWLGKRLLALAVASGTVGYAFHLFGTWPLGVLAIATPIGGWIALILGMQRAFGTIEGPIHRSSCDEPLDSNRRHMNLAQRNLQSIEERRLYGR